MNIYHIFQLDAPALYCSRARASWSGQEVFLKPHLMPLSFDFHAGDQGGDSFQIAVAPAGKSYGSDDIALNLEIDQL